MLEEPLSPVPAAVPPRPANFFPPGLAVRAVRPGDNEAVRTLFIACMSELAPADAGPNLRIALKQYVDSCLNDDLRKASVHYSKPGRRLWVLESQQKEIIATIALDTKETEPRAGHLRRLAVDPRFRRKGVATLLTRRAEQMAVKQGFTVMRLETSSLQPGARKMYESLGYRETRNFEYGPITVFEMEKPLPG